MIYGKPKNDTEPVKGISMYLEVSEMSDKDLLSYEYTVETFENQGLSLALHFENPNVVSVNQEREYIVLELRDFRDQEGNLIAEDQDLRLPVPT